MASPRRALVVPTANPGRSSGNPFDYTPQDDHPLNPGYWESTAAINRRKPAIPRQLHPQNFPQRHRATAANLLGTMKTFTAVVTMAALLKTFAALFDELGGDVGRSAATWGGHEAGYWGRGCSWGRWRRWTGPLVTPARSPWEARPGRVSEGVGMKGWSVGVSGAAWGCSRESAPQSTPTPAQFSLQRQRIPWGRHREHGGLLLQADQPPPPPRRPPPTWTFATTRP